MNQADYAGRDTRRYNRRIVRSKILSRSADTVIYAIVTFMCFLALAPFLYVISMSLSAPEYVLARSVFFYPKGLHLGAYEMIVNTNMIWRSYANTIFYTVISTILNVATSMMGGYFMSKKGVWGKKFFIFFLLIPMFFGGGMIPWFVLVAKLGLYGSPFAIIILSSVSIWNVILCRTFIRTIPESIIDSATIEGAGESALLTQIIVPLSKPIMAVTGLYTAVGRWNSWFTELLILPDKSWQPVQLFLARLLVLETAIMERETGVDAAMTRTRGIATSLQMKYAAVIFCTIPILVSYPILQKYFIKGVMLGSLKE